MLKRILVLIAVVASTAVPASEVAAEDNVWVGAGVGLWIEIPGIFEFHVDAHVAAHFDVDIPWWVPDFHLDAIRDVVPGIDVAKAGIWVGEPPPFAMSVANYDRSGARVIDLVAYGNINPVGDTEIILTNYLWATEEVQIMRDVNGDKVGDSLIFQGPLIEFDPAAFDLEELATVHACPPICVPTVSHWGMIVMMVLVLSAGTIVFAQRRRPSLT